MALLKLHNYNLKKITKENQNTLLWYGSEFCLIKNLKSIYGNHDLFPFFSGIRQRGIGYMYKKTLTKDEQMAELGANLERGNHQLAKSKPEKFEEKVGRDVKYTFVVPFHKLAVEKSLVLWFNRVA